MLERWPADIQARDGAAALALRASPSYAEVFAIMSFAGARPVQA
jgi:hypothetical protein